MRKHEKSISPSKMSVIDLIDQLSSTLALPRGRRRTMSASTVGETRKINVLVVGESPRLFSSFRRLERLGCECHFAESHREVSALLSHTTLTIVLRLFTLQRLSTMSSLVAGLRVSMFYMLPI